MLFRNVHFYSLLLLLLPFITWGQETDSLSLNQDFLHDFLEDIAEQAESEDGEFDNNTFLEDLEQLAVFKINLNNTTVEELMRTNVLTELQAFSIINYTRTYGDFQSIYELKGVLGLDYPTIDKLLPFVVVSDPKELKYSWKDQLTQGKHMVMYRYQQTIEKAKGYTEPEWLQNRWSSRYAGDRSRQYLRYRYHFLRGISYGVTLEKDPGEKLIQDNAKLGVDYISAHLFLEDKGPFRYVALGDFEVNLGQGLLMWQSFGIGKSVSVNNIKRMADVLKPHTSVVEDKFHRGAGATFQKKGFEVTAFLSHRMRDGSSIAVDTLTDENLEVQSLQTSGLHRTESELANRANTKLWATGGRVGWSNRLFSVYLNTTYHKLGVSLTPPRDLYRKFSFRGSSLFNASVNYNYLGKKFNFFGESALSDNGGFALLHGLTSRVAPGITLSIVHRYYAKDYQTLAGGAFGETTSTNPTNEHGLYAGIRFKVHPKITLNNFVDVFHFPWMKYRLDQPNTVGYDIFHEWQYKHSRNLEMYVRFRHKNKARNITDSPNPIRTYTHTKKSSIRYQLNYSPVKSWVFKSRAEMSFFNDGVRGLQKGYLLYQDIGYRHPSGKWNITGRYAIFKVDDYDARIYAYENDVLYAFSIPAYLGTGSRAYLITKIKLHKRLDLWLRYAQMFRNDVEVIGSGLEELPKNTRSEVKVQLRFRI